MAPPFVTSNASDEVLTPTGDTVLIQMIYTGAVKNAVWILIAAAGISLLAVLGLLGILGVSAYKTMRTPNVHRFMRTHIAAYFVSLLLCDAIATTGSLMNGQWIAEGGLNLGTFCTAQGAIKNTGNVGTAMWSMVIAVHTFCLLVMKWKSNDYVLYTTLFVVWLFIGLVVIIGPASVQNMADKGPYFGISGYWCWITDGYAIERVVLEYLWMFLSAFVSLVLYSMTFLTIRGNIIRSGGRLRIRLRRSTAIWVAQTGRDSLDAQAVSLAKGMLTYPIAYTALMLPIAICRFMAWGGYDIPFEVTIFADAVFMLSGFVNVILFLVTRRVVPARNVLFSRSKSTTWDVESQEQMLTAAAHVTPFVVSEKLTIPSTNQLASIPVTVPVPAMKHPRVGTRTVPQRNASHAAQIAFVGSQKPIPDVPESPGSHKTLYNLPNFVKKSIHKKNSSPTVPEPAKLMPYGAHTSSPDALQGRLEDHDKDSDVSSQYSLSSYSSTTPPQYMFPIPLTPPTVLKPPSSSARDYGAPS